MSCRELYVNNNKGSCTFQAWLEFQILFLILFKIKRAYDSKNFPNGYLAQTIDCRFTNCSMEILPRGDVKAVCLNTKCVCGPGDRCKKNFN